MNENLPHLHNLSSRQMMYLNDHHTLGLLQLEMKNFIDCDDLIDCEIHDYITIVSLKMLPWIDGPSLNTYSSESVSSCGGS